MRKQLTLAALIFLQLLSTGCFKKTVKHHLSYVTLKLEKPLEITLTKIGSDSNHFNLVANVESKEVLNESIFSWIVVDEFDQQIFRDDKIFERAFKSATFDSGTLNLPTETENYKIVFVYQGKTKNDVFNKTVIYNSLIQEDVDRAVEELKDRADNY